MKAKPIPGIPYQVKGAYHDTESRKYFSSPEVAAQNFEILKERFFSINRWKDYCGGWSADFKLFDSTGSFVDRMPKVGDFVRIDIPGPGDLQAKGFDWVEIVKIDHQTYENGLERYLIMCRPSKIPDSKSNHIAHFFSRKSSSSFVICKGADWIKAGVYGRNEIPNFSKTDFFGKIRNFIVFIGGSLRLTKIQWKSMTDGLIDF